MSSLIRIRFGRLFSAFRWCSCIQNDALLPKIEEKDEVWSVGEEFEKRKRNDSQDEDEDDDRTVASRSTTKDKKDFIAVNSSPEKSGTTFNSNTHSNSINPSSIGVITTTSDGWRVYNKQSLEEDEDGTGGEVFSGEVKCPSGVEFADEETV